MLCLFIFPYYGEICRNKLVICIIRKCKSCGPDEIPNWVLKNFAPILCRPVCSIFNSSISQGHVPSLWKCANVLPLGKVSQPRSIDSDLRPISLTAVLSKVLEGFVFDWLAAVVMPHIDPFQFGCVKKTSTTHALVHLIHQWLAATESPRTVVRSCLIDFSKAFDRIDHNILLHKLQLLNVPPILLNWCAHFLRDRQLRVKLGNSISTWKPVHAGVPQGTKLGPWFFLVMINDLSATLPLYKYVDDVTLFEVVPLSSIEPPVLQRELDKICEWTSSNNMKLNVTKTKEFIISFVKDPKLLDPLTVNSLPFESINTKLLGVHLSSDLKWATHVEAVCAKASKRLFALRSLKRSTPISSAQYWSTLALFGTLHCRANSATNLSKFNVVLFLSSFHICPTLMVKMNWILPLLRSEGNLYVNLFTRTI